MIEYILPSKLPVALRSAVNEIFSQPIARKLLGWLGTRDCVNKKRLVPIGSCIAASSPIRPSPPCITAVGMLGFLRTLNISDHTWRSVVRQKARPASWWMWLLNEPKLTRRTSSFIEDYDWDHQLMITMFTEEINEDRSWVIFSQASRGVAPWWLHSSELEVVDWTQVTQLNHSSMSNEIFCLRTKIWVGGNKFFFWLLYQFCISLARIRVLFKNDVFRSPSALSSVNAFTLRLVPRQLFLIKIV